MQHLLSTVERDEGCVPERAPDQPILPEVDHDGHPLDPPNQADGEIPRQMLLCKEDLEVLHPT